MSDTQTPLRNGRPRIITLLDMSVSGVRSPVLAAPPPLQFGGGRLPSLSPTNVASAELTPSSRSLSDNPHPPPSRICSLGQAATFTGESRSYRTDDDDDDNKRILERMQAAIADTTGRLRLLVDGTNATTIPGFELTCLRSTLRELTCAHSPKLTRLPMEIGHLHNTLRTLDCSHCALTALPEEVALLHRLEVIDCSYNQLTTFVWRCSALKSLRNVNLAFNKLRYLSPTAAELLLSASSTIDTDLSGNEATMRQTAADDDRAQRALLPVDVDQCEVCDAPQPVLPPRVFIRFVRWKPRDAAVGGGRGVDDGATRFDDTKRTVLVPVLYPCCGPACATALQQWQANVSGRW